MRLSLIVLCPILLLLGLGAAGLQAQESSGLPVDRTQGTLTGTVSDHGGAGLGGVGVKVFEEGFLLAEATTESDGRYRLEYGYLPDIDWTLIVWFVPPEGALIPEIVILRESLKSKDMELWSTCLPRVELKARLHYDVTLLDEEKKLAQMSELDCFGGPTQ